MNIRKKLLSWCPNPTKPVLSSFARLSKPIIACAVLAEIIVLLVVPMTYYAFFVPKSSGQAYGFARTDTPGWNISPNSNATHIYLTNNKTGIMISDTIENTTEINIPDFKSGEITARLYHIWLRYNSTIWIEVPQNYLTATSHPPSIPSDGRLMQTFPLTDAEIKAAWPNLPTAKQIVNREQTGFLGTSMPTEYGVIAVATIAVTIAVSASYLYLKHKRVSSFASN